MHLFEFCLLIQAFIRDFIYFIKNLDKNMSFLGFYPDFKSLSGFHFNYVSINIQSYSYIYALSGPSLNPLNSFFLSFFPFSM